MSKFIIDIVSPDAKVTKEDIESALLWLMNHDGIAFRMLYKVEEINQSQGKETTGNIGKTK